MNIYFVRHGESTHNALGMHQHGEVELSKQGAKQAQFVAKRFENIPVDVIFSSPYQRAAKTAQVIHKIVKKEIIYTDLLKEMKHPSEIEGLSESDERALNVRQARRLNVHKADWHYSDEENIFDLQQRCKELLAFLLNRKEEHILVITHGILLKMIVAVMLFGDALTPAIFLVLLNHFELSNTGITLCEQTQAGEWKLITWNDHAHLG